MPINYPKFDDKIKSFIDDNKFQSSKNRPGVIMSYDRSNNTATVIVDERFSSAVGDIMIKVPCPFTYGIQSVAPSPGTRCLVGFRNDSERDPYIINYYSDPYETPKTILNTKADTGIPKFMV
jgi:hypothetical protein